jgi:hypothetical protein
MNQQNPRINPDGTKRWFNEKNELDRLDGPAVEWVDGSKVWCANGKRHRLDGPAVETSRGGKAWYFNGELHRLDGPAIVRLNGDQEWHIDGKQMTLKEFNQHPLVVFHRLLLHPAADHRSLLAPASNTDGKGDTT